MHELTNVIRGVAYQHANPIPEPELAIFIGLFPCSWPPDAAAPATPAGL